LQRKSADFREAFQSHHAAHEAAVQSHLAAYEADVRTRFRHRLLEIRELHRIANPSTRITWTKHCNKYLGLTPQRVGQILGGSDGNESRRAKKAAIVTENGKSDFPKSVTKPTLTLVPDPDPIPEISETEEDDNDLTSGSVELSAVSEAPSAEAPAASCDADATATCKLAKAPKREPSPECCRAILALEAITNADDRSIVHFWISENWP
jgi:hypothetical protein